jgi:hypothetical protein
MGLLAGRLLITLAIIRGKNTGVYLNINSGLIVLGESIISTAFITFPEKKITALIPFLYDAFKPRVYDPKIIWKVFLVDQYEYDLWGSITV